MGVETAVITVFLAASLIGFKYSLWLVAAVLAAHGIFDAFHDQLITDPLGPPWTLDSFSTPRLLAERLTPEATPIGRAVLRHLDVEGVDEVEVGYGFYPEYWGRGLATEAARACVRIGRAGLGLASVVAVTLPAHAASQRVMVKAGLAYEREIVQEGLAHVLFRTRAA